MEPTTITIGAKEYTLVEMSARKYEETTQSLESEFGEDWQTKGGIKSSIKILMASLKDSEGNYANEDELFDLPIKTINKLAQEVTKINGMGTDDAVKN